MDNVIVEYDDQANEEIFMDSQEKRFADMIRRCLSTRFIVRRKSKELFSNLTSYQKEINNYLLKIGLELKLHGDLGVAYLENLVQLDLQNRVSRAINLNPYETLLTIYLRQKRMDYFTGDPDSEIAPVMRDDLREFLQGFNVEKVDKNFQRNFNNCLNRLIELQILFKMKEEHLFEISPICDLIIPADHIHKLLDDAKKYFANKQSVLENTL